MKVYVIRLQEVDTLASTQEKIGWARSRRILLVYPESKRILASWLDLKLLKRSAAAQGGQLGIVTRDGMVAQHACDLGIPVFSSVRQAERQAWGGRDRQLAFPEPTRRRMRLLRYLKRRAGHARTGKLMPLPLRWGFFALGVFAVLAIAFLLIPRAKIGVSTSPLDQSLAIPVWADRKVSQANVNGRFPAYELSVIVEEESQVAAGGKMLLPLEKAKGQVEFTSLSEKPVSLPAGSVVMTLSLPPVRFITLSKAELKNRNDSVSVEVEALLPGVFGNVEAGSIQALEGDAGFMVAVNNESPTSGGSEKEVATPTDANYQTLKQYLLQRLRAQAIAEMESTLRNGEVLIEQTLKMGKVLHEERHPAEGEPGDVLRLKMKAEFTALYYRRSDMETVARMALDASLPSGYSVISDPVVIIAPEGAELEGEVVRWQIYTVRKIQKMDVLREVPLLVAGRTSKEAQQILSEAFAIDQVASIEIFPDWFGRLPYFPFQIMVSYQ
ncbi:MAG: hypothetical protein HPY45_02885 [Anaerolineae bacterium]|nr:hypothetical protein [Anaerolineae bacterium]